MTDPLTLYVRLDLVIRSLVGKRIEHGPDERRDALMRRLVEVQEQIGKLGVWN